MILLLPARLVCFLILLKNIIINIFLTFFFPQWAKVTFLWRAKVRKWIRASWRPAKCLFQAQTSLINCVFFADFSLAGWHFKLPRGSSRIWGLGGRLHLRDCLLRPNCFLINFFIIADLRSSFSKLLRGSVSESDLLSLMYLSFLFTFLFSPTSVSMSDLSSAKLDFCRAFCKLSKKTNIGYNYFLRTILQCLNIVKSHYLYIRYSKKWNKLFEQMWYLGLHIDVIYDWNFNLFFIWLFELKGGSFKPIKIPLRSGLVVNSIICLSYQ